MRPIFLQALSDRMLLLGKTWVEEQQKRAFSQRLYDLTMRKFYRKATTRPLSKRCKNAPQRERCFWMLYLISKHMYLTYSLCGVYLCGALKRQHGRYQSVVKMHHRDKYHRERCFWMLYLISKHMYLTYSLCGVYLCGALKRQHGRYQSVVKMHHRDKYHRERCFLILYLISKHTFLTFSLCGGSLCGSFLQRFDN